MSELKQPLTEFLSDAVLLQGLPGSGKSTAAESYISQVDQTYYSAVSHYSIGSHLRGILTGTVESQYTELINEGSSSLAKSQRMDDSLVNSVVWEYLHVLTPRSLVLIDAYPLYVEQIDLFVTNALDSGLRVLGMLDFQVDPEVAIQRILTRGTRKNEDTASTDFATRRVDEHLRDSLPTTIALSEMYPFVGIDCQQTESSILRQITHAINWLQIASR